MAPDQSPEGNSESRDSCEIRTSDKTSPADSQKSVASNDSVIQVEIDETAEEEIADLSWAQELALLEAEAEIYGETVWEDYLADEHTPEVCDPFEHLNFSDEIEAFWASHLSQTVDSIVSFLSSQQLVSVGDTVPCLDGEAEYTATQRVQDITERIAAISRAKRALDAVETQLLAQIPESFADDGADPNIQGMGVLSAANQLAIKTRTSDKTISTNINYAYQLTNEYPQVFEQLAGGHISFAHAREIARAGTGLKPKQREKYVEQAIKIAKGCTSGRLKRRLPKLIAELAPEIVECFTKRAYHERRVWVTDAEDDMAILSAVVPAPIAYAALDRLTRMAKQTLKSMPDCSPQPTDEPPAVPSLVSDNRNLSQARADVLAELLLASTSQRRDQRTGDPFGFGIDAKIQVTVPVETLTKPTEEGSFAELEGYGLIDPEIAQLFAADAKSWDRVFVGSNGQVLTTDNYSPSAAIRRQIIARDRRCRFPGCLAPPSQCEIDHTFDWSNGGKTSTANLALLCKRHHALKHPSLQDFSKWKVKQVPGGKLIWTTPAGNTFVDIPDPALRPSEGTRLRARQKPRVRFEPDDPPSEPK